MEMKANEYQDCHLQLLPGKNRSDRSDEDREP
jgi:hypothetical protein